jgi:hypothetical protein
MVDAYQCESAILRYAYIKRETLDCLQAGTDLSLKGGENNEQSCQNKT